MRLGHKRLFALLGLLGVCALLAACGEQAADAPEAADGTPCAAVDVLQYRQPAADTLVAVFDTSAGEFSAVLYPQQAPQAVQNFVTLARSRAYNGLDFHRVIRDFIIQSGRTETTGDKSIWGQPFAAETSDLLHHYTGALAMAGGDANQSQFFVVNCAADSVPEVLQAQMRELGWSEEVITAYAQVGGAPYLDGVYTVFGQVFYGMDAVRAIGETAGAGAHPSEPALLNSVQTVSYADWCAAHPEAEPVFYTPPAESPPEQAAGDDPAADNPPEEVDTDTDTDPDTALPPDDTAGGDPAADGQPAETDPPQEG